MSRLACLFLVALSCGCAMRPEPEEDTSPSVVAITLSPADANAVLALVNYPGTDVATLDTGAALDSRAAQRIVRARNGPDGVCPSADDVLFVNIAAVDAVPYVADAAFRKLVAYAAAHPAPPSETVETVTFLGWESQAVVYGVNHASVETLDAFLDSRAAHALVAAAPYATVAAMGPQPYVGAAVLGKLRLYAPAWWAAMKAGTTSLAGRFDGAVFDEASAHIALDIANHATEAQLTSHGVSVAAARKIISARPFATVLAVSAVTGVGGLTMNALLAYATSGDWTMPPAPGACIASFDAAVAPHLPDLLFLSESDRPFDVVSFPGAGATPPTAASVLALVGAPAGYTAELRTVPGFYDGFESTGGTADPNAAMSVEAAIAAQLTGTIYVAIHAPAGSIDQAEVNVYLVGVTSCGDLVGLHAIAIET